MVSFFIFYAIYGKIYVYVYLDVCAEEVMSKLVLSISILISRNYEGVKRCLDSLRPIMEQVPSELILTDTGCGEKVRELIKGYSDHIIDFEWIKDFSAARNVGLKEAKGEWFLYIDDDEWFDDVTELVDFFNSGECDRYNVASYVQRNYLDMDGKTYGDHNVDRIIRITPKLHFEHRVHEAYTGIDIGTKKKLNTFVHHYGYVYKNEEEKRAKSIRNRELLELECKEYPEDMRMKHQLMMDYDGLGQYDEAIKLALEGIKIKSDSVFWDALHTDLLFCLQAQKKWDEIISFGEKFLQEKLFSFDEFGVRQYLICAYWSTQRYDKVCAVAPKVITTYREYKKEPQKFDVNQLMRDEFWQTDNISKMLLFIIDSALAMEDEDVISSLNAHDIREDMLALTQVDIYRNWLVQMVSATCKKTEQIETFHKLPFDKDVVDFNNMEHGTANADSFEFNRLEFEPSFFEAETRDGFYIEPLIKNAWAAQLETLNIFDQICEANGLTYCADQGTLLGAIRHGGFIPWDDDFDVCMPREDLEKLYNIIPNYPQLECLNPYNAPDLGIHATRINLSRAFTIDRDSLKDYHGFPFPVGIDIFAIDYVPRDKGKEKEQISLMEKANYAANLTILIEQHDEKEEAYIDAYKKYVRELRDELGIEFSKDEPDLQELTILYNEIESTYGEEESDYVSEVARILIGQDYYLPKDTYKNITRIPFENTTIPVPNNYDDLLKLKYGEDYMTPNNTGASHDYPFYNEFIQNVMDKSGRKSFDETKAHIEKISSDYYRAFINRTDEPKLQIEEDKLNRSDAARVQAALLEILSEVDRLCNNNNIEYYYIGNTRNEIEEIREFSSESTDIHIGMRRMDYMRFQQILQEELDPWFDYRSIYSHTNHFDLRTYVITDAYRTCEGEYQRRFHGCNDIVGIDIAAIDDVSDDNNTEELKKTVITNLLEIIPNLPEAAPYSQEVLDVVAQWEEILHIGINTEGNLKNEFAKAADSVAMSDTNDGSARCRITADISEENYRLYNKGEVYVRI